MSTNTYKIAVVEGDGTGPEVIREALKVLKKVSENENFILDFVSLDLTGQRYIDTGKLLEQEDMDTLSSCQAILLGAIGHPQIKPGILERGILLKLRFMFDQFINYRPVQLFENVESPIKNVKPEDINYVVIRENTGGLYSGIGGNSMVGTKNETAEQTMLYTYQQVYRCLKFAFETVLKRNVDTPWRGLSDTELKQGYIGKLTLCGKSNVLTYVFDLWNRVLDDLSKEYPNVLVDYVHVDAVCIYMIECPETFDVIVTTNMFGDIITDLAATTQGGMGVAASGNINPEGLSMFEPIGGTAPKFTGLNQINPMAAIGAAQLMLEYLGEKKAADKIDIAKRKVINEMDSMAAGNMGFTTEEIGNKVVKYIR